ncbi:hypothetical protein [Brachyspira pilosicoli]|uniref:hypothetical protein n=1 Tax=Brachyspira pilosicoli TaxID=52584 RepID=UPI001CA511DD|nr:hypothetical protein [Brachyspira pilosicoli]MBW5382867.1 hypothetical protein [Brachyspira pilosicoli]
MNKKLLSLISVLFLISLLAVSCSNANKTGSGDNNSGNGGSGIGGDGSTTPTPEGIAKYAGTWTAKFNANSSYIVIIDNDGKVTIDNGSINKKEATDIVESGNTYTIKIQHITGVDDTITITFTDVISGSITDTSDAFGAGASGVIRKQNNGNKGLWYYEGTWILTPNQQPAQAEPNPTITIGNDGSVTYSNEKSTDVTDKGNETYEVKFTPESERESILTLIFGDDHIRGTFTLSIPKETPINGTMTKQ